MNNVVVFYNHGKVVLTKFTTVIPRIKENIFINGKSYWVARVVHDFDTDRVKIIIQD